MAQQVQVLLIDDLDGGEGTETVQFSLDGTSYEIDLSDDNARKLRKDIGLWADAGRRAGTKADSNGAPKNRRRTAEGRVRNDDIRAWAKQEGYKVSDRGRISPLLIAEYDAAHT